MLLGMYCLIWRHSYLLAVDDPSGILNLGKPFIQGFLSLINFLKARNIGIIVGRGTDSRKVIS